MASSAQSLAARAAAHAKWAKNDPVQGTAAARAVADSRFERQVVADAAAKGEVLSESEVVRRTEHARKAYFIALAAKSAKVRAARKAAKS